MEFLKKIPDWLRWLLFLPVAFIALLISYPLITIVNKITMIWFLGDNNFLVNLGILVLASLWSAVAFIWVGATVAPRSNFIVSIVLATIYTFILGASFISRLMLGENSSVSWLEMAIAIITGIIAVVGVIYYFHEKKGELARIAPPYDDLRGNDKTISHE
jgi:hypothetical protein